MLSSFFDFFIFSYNFLFFLLLLPFCGFVCAFLVSREFLLGGLFAVFCMGLAAFSAIILFIKTNYYDEVYCKTLCGWFFSVGLEVNWSFMIDKVTGSMLLIITFISFLVHLYSLEYMWSDPHLNRFLSYLSFFTFFMICLVAGDNLLVLFFGWEGVGLCSFLLINFWSTRVQANKAAIKAIIMNRIGDLGLILGIGLILHLFGTVSYSSLSYSVFFRLYTHQDFFSLFSGSSAVSCACYLLVIGVMGKSAQIGLHTWLPDAMEGPTPVSALIHAATMVTAGLFLIIRLSFFFEYARVLGSDVLTFIALLGGLTAFIAGSVGLVQNDIKKIIAYSTCSQLGYMGLSCGFSAYSLALSHLVNHAFFKALLFLCAGAVIHAVKDEQDIRKMGGLLNLMPFTHICMFVASLSLMGFPFLTGFYSKDIILELVYAEGTSFASFIFWLGLIAAFFTAFYSFRLLYFVFYAPANNTRLMYNNVHEPGFFMSLPLFILALFSIVIGYFFKELYFGFGGSYGFIDLFLTEHQGGDLGVSTKPIVSTNFFLGDVNLDRHFFFFEFIPFIIKMLPFLISLLGVFIVYIFYESFCFYAYILRLNFNLVGYYFYFFLNRKWFFDKIYNNITHSFFLKKFAYALNYILNQGILSHFMGLLGFSHTFKKHYAAVRTGISGFQGYKATLPHNLKLYLGFFIYISFFVSSISFIIF